MEALKSDLTDPRYGYDFVLASTQKSINATMKKYMDQLGPKVTYLCYQYDDAQKQNVLVENYEAYRNDNFKDVDPFAIAKNVDANHNTDIDKLDNAGFVAAVKITLGLPQNISDPSKLPDIIDLREGTDSVIYNMLCADIQVVQLSYARRNTRNWESISQNDTQNSPWMFQSKVNLRLDSADFAKLPENVKEGIKNLDGAMFGVQQLLFDLNNAGLSQVPEVKGLDPTSDASVLLTKYFVNGYFKPMHDHGQPVLNYVVQHKPQESTLKPTDLNFGISPLVGALDPTLKTLDYLCATGGKPLPPAVLFTWDWLNAQDASQYHGVISINRNTFANYLIDALRDSVMGDCFVPKTKCDVDGIRVSYHAYADPVEKPKPSFTITPTQHSSPPFNLLPCDVIIIKWSDTSYDEAGDHGALGHIKLSQEYTKMVMFGGNTITIITWQKIFLEVRVLGTTNAANITDKTRSDKYELGVDGDGRMTCTPTTTTNDDSQSDSANWLSDWFTNINSLFNFLAARQFTPNDFQATKLSAFQDFVFPGGNTFAFKNFQFSNSQDLLAAITYVDP